MSRKLTSAARTRSTAKAPGPAGARVTAVRLDGDTATGTVLARDAVESDIGF